MEKELIERLKELEAQDIFAENLENTQHDLIVLIIRQRGRFYLKYKASSFVWLKNILLLL